MTDLDFQTGISNLGGNSTVRFAAIATLASLPPPAASGPSSAATFQSGFRWYSCYGSEGSKTFDEKQTGSDNGPIWSVSVQAFLPGDGDDRRKQLADLARHRFVVEIEDNNGSIRRVGTLTESLEMSYDFTTGGPMGDRKGYKLTFSGTLTRPAPIITY